MPKDSTLQELDELHRQARRARAKLEPIWYLNLAYYYGEQWIAWDGNGLFRPRLRPDRITIVDNRIQPCVRMEIAKMTKTRPIFTVTPRTSDPEDAHAAEMGDQIMRYLWKHLNMLELFTKGLHWSRITGAGFAKVFWDPTLGQGTDAVVGPNGRVLTDTSGKPFEANKVNPEELTQALGVQVGVKRVNQGDVRLEIRSPFQMFPDPLADSFSECEWIIEESVKSVESCQRRYGITLPADSISNPGLIEARMGAVFLPGSAAYRGVRIKEYWCKPNPAHPRGRHAIWSKDHLLLEEEPFDPFPYVMFSSIPMPGRLWPTSITEQLRGPQTELNKVKSQIAENRNRVGNPTILASKQAVQDPGTFADTTTMPGGIYFFDDIGSPNSVPTYLQAPPLPQYVIDEIARIEESIQEISGQHDVNSAQVPPGVTAASAINLLLEADDTRLAPGILDYETQLERIGQKMLKLVAKYYTDPRTIRIAGDQGRWQIFDFRGSMLRDNTHLEVQAGSAFPQSKAAKQAAMQDLLTFFVQSGNPPHGKQLAQFLKDWEIGGVDKLIEDYTHNESQANRENVQIQQGIPVELHSYDDDQAHIDSHQDCQREQHYETWSPNAKAIMEAHVAAHQQRLAQQQQAQMQLEMQMQGGQPQGLQEAQGAQDLAGTQMQQAQQQQAAGQQQNIQAAQAQHDNEIQSAQAGQQMATQNANTAQQQRHAEEAHQQQMRHKEEQHQAALAARQQAARQQTQPQKGSQR